MTVPRLRQISCSVFAAAAWLCGAAMAADSIESVEKAATEWARIRSETVREQSVWRWEKGFLEATLATLTERARGLEERRTFLEASTASRRDDFAERGLKVDEALAFVAVGEERIALLSRQLIDLRPFLPPRLSQALEYAYRSLEDPAMSVGERMQTIASVFNRCTQFNGALTYAEEMLDLEPDASPRFVSVLYWGLSHGYALDSADGSAYLGAPGAGGWTWTPRPEISAKVSSLMAIYHDRATPEFVEAPAQVLHPLVAAEERGADD